VGVVAAPGLAPGLERKRVGTVRMIPVASPRHPLARHEGTIPFHLLADALQIVLAERGEEGTADQGVLSPRTWRVADLSTKHAMIRGGLGWGNLPDHMARDDLRTGKLVAIHPDGGSEGAAVDLFAIYRKVARSGPAQAWLLERLETFCTRDTEPEGEGAPRAGGREREKRRKRSAGVSA
jgi:DNA-binding transcriptional LysR family regulator